MSMDVRPEEAEVTSLLPLVTNDSMLSHTTSNASFVALSSVGTVGRIGASVGAPSPSAGEGGLRTPKQEGLLEEVCASDPASIPPDSTLAHSMNLPVMSSGAARSQTQGGGVGDHIPVSSSSLSSDGKVHVWVKGEHYLDSEALKVTLSSTSSVGDLLMVSFDLFRIGQHGGVRPADVEVTWRGQPVSNRQSVAALLQESGTSARGVGAMRKYRKTHDAEGKLVSVEELAVEELFVVRSKFSRYPSAEKYRRPSPNVAVRRRSRTPTKPGEFRRTATYGSPRDHGETPRPAGDRLSKKEVEDRLAQAYYSRETVREQLRSMTVERSHGQRRPHQEGSSITIEASGTPTDSHPTRTPTRSTTATAALSPSLHNVSRIHTVSEYTIVRGGGDWSKDGRHQKRGDATAVAVNPVDDVVDPAKCAFIAMWGTPLCGNCGCRRDLHKDKPPTTLDIQKQLLSSVTRQKEVGLGSSSSARKPRSALWTSTSPKRSHGGVKPVCTNFVAVWGRPNACGNCGHPAQYHDKVPEDKKAISLANAKRPPPPTHPYRHSVVTGRIRGVCSEFVPLWNQNDHCTNCYHAMEDHRVADLPSYQKTQYIKKTMSAAEVVAKKLRRDTLRMCALPWHEVLPWCQVTDLFHCAQLCRLITMVARPILEATMLQVLEFEITEERDDLWRKVVQVAENLAPYCDVARHMLATCLVIVHTATEGQSDGIKGGSEDTHEVTSKKLQNEATEEKIGNFNYRIDMVKQIACIHPMSIDENCGKEITDLESFRIDNTHDLYPLLVYLRALWLQHSVKSKAQRYLQRTKVFL